MMNGSMTGLQIDSNSPVGGNTAVALDYPESDPRFKYKML
jgi:hypothetical protein